jgi:Acyl-CoA reductase (LuxC)
MNDGVTLDGFFLPPPIKISTFSNLAFGPVEIRLPVMTATSVSDLVNQLLAAQERYLAKLSTETLINILDATVANWLNPDNRFRKMAEEMLPHITGFSPPMVRLGLTRMFEGYRKDGLVKILAEELGDMDRLDGFRPDHQNPCRWSRAVGPRITTSVLSGNVPALGAVELMATLLIKSACLCKVSSAEPLFAPLFIQSLVQVEPRLAYCLAALGWTGGSPETVSVEEIAFGRTELVTATGSDQAVKAIHAATTRFGSAATRFIGYGHRVSLAMIGREALDDLNKVAGSAAMDIAMYDQQGCLSPHVFYVETGGTHFPRQFAKSLGQELARLEVDLPRGAIDTSTSARLHQMRSVAEIRQSDGEEVIVFGSETGTLWTVIYEADPAFVLSPLYRTVRVKPIDDLMQVLPHLDIWRPYLQTAGIAVANSREVPLAEALAHAGFNRISPVGRMQEPLPGWSQDGRRFIADRVRWVNLEKS